MRLWHQLLIPYLPSRQLLGQHRELCALRGLGFGRKHRVVDYVFIHPYAYLYHFHLLVMDEMQKRNFYVDYRWYSIMYRGKRIGDDLTSFTKDCYCQHIIYSEHDVVYLEECLHNLYNKGIRLVIKKEDDLYIILKNYHLLSYVLST